MSSSTSSLLGEKLGGQRSDSSVDFSVDCSAPRFRERVKHFLESRFAHLIVIALVALDTVLVIADLYIELFACEERERHEEGEESHENEGLLEGLHTAQTVLRAFILAIAVTFLIELIFSLYAFGLAYFRGKGKWLRILDAVVIVGSVVFDSLEQGPLAEGAELIVVLRLWRIIKISNEIGNETTEKVEELKEDNHALRGRVTFLEQELATMGAVGFPVEKLGDISAQSV
ncbi:hypothetical protein V1509DRAFT_636223 [Lipomyces kononenkoae]